MSASGRDPTTPEPDVDRSVVAQRVSMFALVVSIAGSLTLAIVYVRGGDPRLEGLGLLGALGGLGVALVVWGRHLLDEGEASEPRADHTTTDVERRGVEESIDRDAPIARRAALRRLLIAAGAAFAAALVFPIRSLGPAPGPQLSASPWRRGLRLVDERGRVIRAAAIPVDGLVTAFPEGQPGSAQGQVAVVRVRPDAIRGAARRKASPDGLLAYSKVCTHAGCPVSLYLADSHELLCPCHQSSFDALNGAAPVQGPAARALPELPLAVDDEGVLRAAGDLSAPIGPGWWDHP